MTLKTSLTGSLPPLYDPNKPIRGLPTPEQDEIVHHSIERVVQLQIDLGIDILVDGQVRDDIVSLFCKGIPGLAGDTLPYHVVGKIRPADQPFTVADYLYATQLAHGKPLKAHVTGPMTIAQNVIIDPGSGYAAKTDPTLIRDIAVAIGQEARSLVEAGAEVVQIDEPVLADLASEGLDIAFEAMRQIIEVGEVPIAALHICGNICRVFDHVLDHSPVKVISMEGAWLRSRELAHINHERLERTNKQIGLGCITVADYTVERLRTVQNFLDQMVVRLNSEYIWAVMTNCGLRPMPFEVAREKLKVMVEAARSA